MVAKCAIKACSLNVLDGLIAVVKYESANDILENLKFKNFYLSLQKQVELMGERRGSVVYPFLYFNEKDESTNHKFVAALARMKPYFEVMLKMIEHDFINNSRLLLFDTSLYSDAEFKKAGNELKFVDLKLPEVMKDRIFFVKKMYNFYFNEFNEKEATYLVGDPARGKSLDLQRDSFDILSTYENLKHRIYPETFNVADSRPDASKLINPGDGVGDFVAKFKGDKELIYCEGKTPHYFAAAGLVGYLKEENYFDFKKNMYNYVESVLKKAHGEMQQHYQLIYHIDKDRQVAYVFNFCNIYTRDYNLILKIEVELNNNKDLKQYLPSSGIIRLACSKLDDKIIQSEKLD